MLQKVPVAGAIVAAGVLLALLIWARWPKDDLVIQQGTITKPFENLTPFRHETPPSSRLMQGGQG